MGILASLTANIAANGQKQYKPADFIPRFETKRQSVDDMKAILMAACGISAAAQQAKQKVKGPSAKRAK